MITYSRYSLVVVFLLVQALQPISVHAQPPDADPAYTLSPAELKNRPPLILIPGILGSALRTNDGIVLWGRRDSYLNIGKLILTEHSQPLISDGMIESVQIIGPISMNVYNSLISILEKFQYTRNENLFVFDYDWRKSNFDNAINLKKFIDGTPKLANGHIDILAHSMGGIVAVIFVAEHDTDKRVRRIVTLSTPYLGSATAIRTLVGGWGSAPNWLAGGMQTVRRALLSWPSFFELLPRHDDPCCIVGHATWPRNRKYPMDILDIRTWERMQWLDSETDYRAALPEIERGLASARKLKDLLDEVKRGSKGGHARIFAISGAFLMADARHYFDAAAFSRKKPRITSTVRTKGDETVVALSGTYLGEIGFPTLGKHDSIWEHALTEAQLEQVFMVPEGATIRLGEFDASHEWELPVGSRGDDNVVWVESADVTVSENVAKSGDRVRITVTLCSPDPKVKGIIRANVKSLTADNKVYHAQRARGAFQSVNEGQDCRSKAVLSTMVAVGGPAGVARVVVSVSDFKDFSQFVAVVP